MGMKSAQCPHSDTDWLGIHVGHGVGGQEFPGSNPGETTLFLFPFFMGGKKLEGVQVITKVVKINRNYDIVDSDLTTKITEA